MDKKTKIRDFIMKDVGWKILSLVIALSLWFIVINIENPVESRSYTVSLEVRNTELITQNNQTISNLNEIVNSKITVKITGQRLALDKLSQNKDFLEAYVDLATVDWVVRNDEVVELPIVVRLPSNLSSAYEIDSRNLGSVYLHIENMKSVEMPVELQIEGGISANHAMAEPEITPGTVMVQGTQNLVDSVVGVRAVILVSNLNEDTTYQAPLIAYDANDMEVLGVSLSKEFADIYIPVQASKKVTLTAETIGMPMDGYVFDSIVLEPETIYVLGDKEVLENLEEVMLPAINISGRSEDLEISFVLKYLLPEGVTLKVGEVQKVEVKVILSSEEVKDVVLNKENITLDMTLEEGLQGEAMLENILLQVKGGPEVLDVLSEEDITAQLVVADLAPGEYRLPLTLSMPEGVRIVGGESPYVTVIVTEAPQGGEEM